MTLANYDDIQAAIGNVLDRSDLAAVIPDWITMCEASVSRNLRHWRMSKRVSGTVSTRYTALPNDWQKTERYDIYGYRRLELASVGELERMRAKSDAAGQPCFYTITGGDIELYPTPDTTYETELVYFSDIPALSAASPTNWLLTEAPDVYLYGSLIHSAPYLIEDQRLMVWGGLYRDAIDGLQLASDRARHSGAALRLR